MSSRNIEKIKVLHITAHLGGGVGRVLSEIALSRKENSSRFEDIFICLERPEKCAIQNEMIKHGIEIHSCPSLPEIEQLIAVADLVQLEWWHHPLLAELLSKLQSKMRLVMWSHTSGLHYPDIPAKLVQRPHAFIFTTPLSLAKFSEEKQRSSNIITAVNSSGGFSGLPVTEKEVNADGLQFNYLGSLNFSKLNPLIVDYIRAVDLPGFVLNFYGDIVEGRKLEALAKSAGVGHQMCIKGFTHAPFEVLGKTDVFVYLLNPTHYGTTENALLEAMAMQAVPIVLNNPVESNIVTHEKTGLVVDSPEAFSLAIVELAQNSEKRLRLAHAASDEVRKKYSLESTINQLDPIYDSVMKLEKKVFQFQDIFGNAPADWFFSALGSYQKLFTEEEDRESRLEHPVLYENSKSSAFQYYRYFPDDLRLKKWVELLTEDLKEKGEFSESR